MMMRVCGLLLLSVWLITGPSGGARAATCTLPYVLQNGVVPDATQVMANFYALLNCVNTGGGSGTITSITLSAPPELSPVGGSPCTGPACNLIIPKAPEAANTVWAGPTSGAAAPPTFRPLPYEVTLGWSGVPPNGLVLLFSMDGAATCPTGFAGSTAGSEVAPTAAVTVNVNQVTSSGTRTPRGTIAWGAGAAAFSQPTFASSGGMTLAATDFVELAFPASADATFATPSVTLKCVRS